MPRIVERWAASGALGLTGRPDGPALGPPAGLVPWLDRMTTDLCVDDDEPLVLLTERAALMGLTRRGTTSCGGATRLVQARDGWLAVALAREDDVAVVPAWLETAIDAPFDTSFDTQFDTPGAEPPWSAVTALAARRSVTELVERAVLVGLPVSSLGEASSDGTAPALTRWSPSRPRGPADRPTFDIRGARVVDLSSLWAGPLCGDLLAAAGADVVKVESTTRPDGGRRGEPRFFDRLNARKRSVALDLSTRDGAGALRALVDRADIVIEASRPRALAQLGVDARRWVAASDGRAWVSITGHGRDDDGPGRVAFGDDAAVAGGLVAWEDGEPRFCADAIADPLTGVAAAAATIEARAAGVSVLLALSMAGVAADASGPTLPVPDAVRAMPPRARAPIGRAPSLGAHTAAVLDDWAVAR